MAQQNRKQARRSQPASTHPHFPALVTAWFAALLGLGSLAVKSSLIDAQILASRFDTLIPFAAPPLGITGRIVLAVLCAAIGAVIGAGIARLVAPRKGDTGEPRAVAAFELAGHAEPPAAVDLAPEAWPVPQVALPDVPTVTARQYDLPEPGVAETKADTAAPPEVRPLASNPIRQTANLPEGSGAQRIATGNLGDLSPVEMLERLALSIQQRERSGPAAPSVTVTYAPKIVPGTSAPPARTAIDGAVWSNPEAIPQEREIGFDDFDGFGDFGEEAEHARLQPPSLASQPLATLTPMAKYAEGEVDTGEDEEYEAEDDVCEEVYSSLLRVSRPADPTLRLMSGASAENVGQSGGDAPEPEADSEPAPGGRLAKLQRLSRDG